MTIVREVLAEDPCRDCTRTGGLETHSEQHLAAFERKVGPKITGGVSA